MKSFYWSDVCPNLGAMGVKDLGTVRGLVYFGTDLIFVREDDGQIGYQYIRASEQISEDQVLKIVAHAESHSKHDPMSWIERLPHIDQVLEQVRLGVQDGTIIPWWSSTRSQ